LQARDCGPAHVLVGPEVRGQIQPDAQFDGGPEPARLRGAGEFGGVAKAAHRQRRAGGAGVFGELATTLEVLELAAQALDAAPQRGRVGEPLAAEHGDQRLHGGKVVVVAGPADTARACEGRLDRAGEQSAVGGVAGDDARRR
jgi:hypothetical protein